MSDEHSAGAVIYHQSDGSYHYLLLQYPQGHWDFPRGHIEFGETPFQTAQREIREETGLDNLIFDTDFREDNEWRYRLPGGGLSHKVATYFLAGTATSAVRLSSEHRRYRWLTYERALDLLTFKNVKEILKKVHKRLTIQQVKHL